VGGGGASVRTSSHSVERAGVLGSTGGGWGGPPGPHVSGWEVVGSWGLSRTRRDPRPRPGGGQRGTHRVEATRAPPGSYWALGLGPYAVARGPRKPACAVPARSWTLHSWWCVVRRA